MHWWIERRFVQEDPQQEDIQLHTASFLGHPPLATTNLHFLPTEQQWWCGEQQQQCHGFIITQPHLQRTHYRRPQCLPRSHPHKARPRGRDDLVPGLLPHRGLGGGHRLLGQPRETAPKPLHQRTSVAAGQRPEPLSQRVVHLACPSTFQIGHQEVPTEEEHRGKPRHPLQTRPQWRRQHRLVPQTGRARKGASGEALVSDGRILSLIGRTRLNYYLVNCQVLWSHSKCILVFHSFVLVLSKMVVTFKCCCCWSRRRYCCCCCCCSRDSKHSAFYRVVVDASIWFVVVVVHQVVDLWRFIGKLKILTLMLKWLRDGRAKCGIPCVEKYYFDYSSSKLIEFFFCKIFVLKSNRILF